MLNDTPPPDHQWINPFSHGYRAGCFACAHWLGQLSGGHAVCVEGGGLRVIGVAADGCCYWLRATGVDS